MSVIAGMTKEDFFKYLNDPAAVQETAKMNWVALLAELRSREVPFTVKTVFAELIEQGHETKRNYVYSHLRDWAAEGKILGPVKSGIGNVYLGMVTEEE